MHKTRIQVQQITNGISTKERNRKSPLRYKAAVEQGREYIAVLDLKVAYDRVPRGLLMDEIELKAIIQCRAQGNTLPSKMTFQ